MTMKWEERLVEANASKMGRIDTSEGPIYLMPPSMAWLVQFVGAKPAGYMLGMAVLEIPEKDA